MLLTKNAERRRGQIHIGISTLISILTAAVCCLVFYFLQVISLCTNIQENRTKIEAVQQVQHEQRETMKEIQRDIKTLLREATK